MRLAMALSCVALLIASLVAPVACTSVIPGGGWPKQPQTGTSGSGNPAATVPYPVNPWQQPSPSPMLVENPLGKVCLPSVESISTSCIAKLPAKPTALHCLAASKATHHLHTTNQHLGLLTNTTPLLCALQPQQVNLVQDHVSLEYPAMLAVGTSVFNVSFEPGTLMANYTVFADPLLAKPELPLLFFLPIWNVEVGAQQKEDGREGEREEREEQKARLLSCSPASGLQPRGPQRPSLSC